MSTVTDCSPHDGVVLLLDITVVVLLVWPATREGYTLLLAVIDQMMVDEFLAVIRVYPQQMERHSVSDIYQSPEHPC